MYVTFRKAGSSTLGETEAVRLVGPTAPATRRHWVGSWAVILSAALRASIEACLLISNTNFSSP